MRGWQPTGAVVKSEAEYEYSASGTWQTAKDATAINADGNENGRGRLVGVIMKDYQLSTPFDVGTHSTFTPPDDGQLYRPLPGCLGTTG